MYPYLSNIMLLMAIAYALSILYSLSYCTQYFTYVLLLWLGVLTLWKANIYQAIFMLSASEYVFPILIGILIAVRIKAECYG